MILFLRDQLGVAMHVVHHSDVTTSDVIPVCPPQHKSLYVSSDTGLRQVYLEMCNGRADSCLRCVRDPYCGWEKDQRTCRPYVPG